MGLELNRLFGVKEKSVGETLPDINKLKGTEKYQIKTMGNNIKESLALNSECPFAFIIGNKFRYYEKGLGVFVYSNTPGIIPLFG